MLRLYMNDASWKPYIDNRVITYHKDGFAIIVPIDKIEPIPIFCDICKYVLRSYDDETSYRELGCCNRCAMQWAHSRRELWASGWRPTDKQVEEFEKLRLPMMVTMNVD